MRRVAIALIATSVTACSPAPPVAPASPPVVVAPGDNKPPTWNGKRTIDATLTFDDMGLHARVVIDGPPEELRRFRVPQGKVVDPDGAARTGHVDFAYDIAGERTGDDPKTTIVDVARFRVTSENAFVLPLAWIDGAQPVAIHLSLATKDAPVVASSFGARTAKGTQGARFERDLEVTTAELARAVFVGGGGGRAEFDAPEGHDEAAWLGYTAFDPRAVAAEVAGFRSLLNEYFFGKELRPATLLFYVDERANARYRVARYARSVFVLLSGRDAFDASLRLAVAHELVHAWIGERMWIGRAEAGHEAEGYWFQEGVARWVAREQLARAGLLSPDELAAEMNRILSLAATSRYAELPRAALVEKRKFDDGLVPILVARGVLFATAVDARIRDASKGKESFDDVVRLLARRAEDRPVRFDESTFLATLEKYLPDGPKTFQAMIVDGTERRVPESALGGCFEARNVDYDALGVGFDVDHAKLKNEVRGLDPKGPAAKAGLVEGQKVDAVSIPERADGKVSVLLPSGAMVQYPPTRTPKRGQAFKKRAGLSDDACRKLFVRR